MSWGEGYPVVTRSCIRIVVIVGFVGLVYGLAILAAVKCGE